MHNAEGAEGGGGGKEGREFMGVSLSPSPPRFCIRIRAPGNGGRGRRAGERPFWFYARNKMCIFDAGIGASHKDAFFAAAFPDTALYLFVPNIYVCTSPADMEGRDMLQDETYSAKYIVS